VVVEARFGLDLIRHLRRKLACAPRRDRPISAHLFQSSILKPLNQVVEKWRAASLEFQRVARAAIFANRHVCSRKAANNS